MNDPSQTQMPCCPPCIAPRRRREEPTASEKGKKKAMAMCMYRISSLHIVSLISFLCAVIRVGEKKEIKEMRRGVTVIVFVIRYKKRISLKLRKGCRLPYSLGFRLRFRLKKKSDLESTMGVRVESRGDLSCVWCTRIRFSINDQ